MGELDLTKCSQDWNIKPESELCLSQWEGQFIAHLGNGCVYVTEIHLFYALFKMSLSMRPTCIIYHLIHCIEMSGLASPIVVNFISELSSTYIISMFRMHYLH